MFKTSPLDLRKSLTDAEFTIHLYKLTIKELNENLESFESYGMLEDYLIILDILNQKINQIVTRIEL
jgi:hypothetical protein